MQEQKTYEMDLCSGSIAKKMLLFAFPLICSGMLQLLFNAADIVVVGRFAGDSALAAVGANTSLITLFTNMFLGISVGVNVLAARYYGAKKAEELNQTIHTSILFSIYSGIVLTIIGCVGARTLLTWMQAPEEVLGQAILYLRIYCLGMVSILVYNFGSAILRAVGDTKRPLYYLSMAGVINIILNLILVIVCRLGVAGVAIATTVSQTISACLVVKCLIKDEGALRLDLKKMKIDRKRLAEILKIGLPAGLQNTLFALSNVIIQSSINSFGTAVIAGNSAAYNIGMIEYMAMNAFHHAAVSFVSQNYGAKQYKRIHKIVFVAWIYAVVAGLIVGNLGVVFGETLLGIYTSSPDVIAAGMVRMRIMDRTHFLVGAMEIMAGAIRGLGYSVLPMVVTLLGSCALRLVWTGTVFQIPEYHTLQVLYASYPISWFLTFLAHFICYFIINRKMKKLLSDMIEV